jgi:hypothetical protein
VSVGAPKMLSMVSRRQSAKVGDNSHRFQLGAIFLQTVIEE